jgi:CCR4-NOT transcription complex subunit 3
MAQRKLQQEIDKTIKKIQEGISTFQATYEKLQLSSNQAQKEKLEENLKTQIKKLQRNRDQLKSWAAGNEVKDKKPLLDNRKAIETVC